MKFRKFRGLAALSVALLSLVSFATVLAYDNEGQINLFLGIGQKQGVGSEFNSVDEMRAAEEKNEIQTQEEGSVLFWNNKEALPLSKGNKITLLGRTAADNIYKGGSGGSTTNAETGAASLYDSLKNEGFEINDKVFNALKDSKITRQRGNIGEVPGSFYTSELTETFGEYSDAAVIVLGRYSGEQQDLTAGGDSNKDNEVNENGDPVDVEGVPMLSLHQSEKDIIKLAKSSGKFKKIVVLLNTTNPTEIDELESLGVDACMWIGVPGYAGFKGVAKLLSGEADPSGRLVDTYAANSLSAPAMRNYGSFTWANFDEMSAQIKGKNANYKLDGKDHYNVYAEGIYLGYKYYETRYQDQVLNQNNAKSSKGVYASKGGSWNYADEMSYTFGYGSSYADFNEEVQSIDWDQNKHEVTAKVKVTSLGVPSDSTYKGKSKKAVELYVQLPYEKGQAEKSAIQLVGYGKTKELAKGESDTVTITVSDYMFATYDSNAVNGADTSKKGCYVFDKGDYYFTIGNDAHDALNNVLEARNVSGLFDAKGESVHGNANNVKKVNLAELDNKTHATNKYSSQSKTEEFVVSNQFEDMDMNHFVENSIQYMTRDNWETYPNRITGLKATSEMTDIIDGHNYVKPADAKDVTTFAKSVVYGTGEGENPKYEAPIKLVDMIDVEFTDTKWQDFIDQLSPSELAAIPGEKFGNAGIERLGIPQTSAADGPDGIQAKMGFSHVCESLAASTYNDELIEKRGKFLAEDGIACGQHGVYGFGANMHRTVYAGRNFEYYSEDMTLSYLAGAVQTRGANKLGLTTYVKHFCANDQEVWRNGSATIMTEQAYRQGPLKGFEGSFTKGESLGTMTSNARAGLRTVSMCKATMTTVLRNEWGFKGTGMTDSSKGATGFLYTEESIDAGIDQFNNDETRGSTDIKNLMVKQRDGYIWEKTREVAHHLYYTLSRNFVMNEYLDGKEVVVETPWWKPAVWAIIGTLGAVSIGLLAVTLFTGLKKTKEVK